MRITAHEISASPENYNKIVIIGKHEYECAGYSRTGNTVKFFRLIPIENMKIKVIVKYINYNKLLKIKGD
jgi:hypothetical protein